MGEQSLTRVLVSFLSRASSPASGSVTSERNRKAFLSEASANAEGMRERPALLAAATSRFPSEPVESLSNRAAARCAAPLPCPGLWPVADRRQDGAACVSPRAAGCLQPSVGQAGGWAVLWVQTCMEGELSPAWSS